MSTCCAEQGITNLGYQSNTDEAEQSRAWRGFFYSVSASALHLNPNLIVSTANASFNT